MKRSALISAGAIMLLLGAACVLCIGLGSSAKYAWLAPSATVAAASTAALVALRLNESADDRRAAATDQRQRELRAEQRERYEQLVASLLRQFQGTAADESVRRPMLVAWGSAELITLMDQWYELVRSTNAIGGHVPEDLTQQRELLAQIALLTRELTGLDEGKVPPTRDEIGKLLFDDWPRLPSDK